MGPALERIVTPAGVSVSYRVYGEGPPLVLVHGAFSDHDTNWEFVAPRLAASFTVYAIARRGRGATDATTGHGIADEAADVLAVLEAIGAPAFLLGHSYGALVALEAARAAPAAVRKLVLYEPAWPRVVDAPALATLEGFAARGDWDGLAAYFFSERLGVPDSDLRAVRDSPLWLPIVDDAEASLGDLRGLSRYRFDPVRHAGLDLPVLLQIGSESPRSLYVTDALSAALPDARIAVLAGQAHEGMTTAPDLYAQQVLNFLDDGCGTASANVPGAGARSRRVA